MTKDQIIMNVAKRWKFTSRLRRFRSQAPRHLDMCHRELDRLLKAFLLGSTFNGKDLSGSSVLPASRRVRFLEPSPHTPRGNEVSSPGSPRCASPAWWMTTCASRTGMQTQVSACG